MIVDWFSLFLQTVLWIYKVNWRKIRYNRWFWGLFLSFLRAASSKIFKMLGIAHFESMKKSEKGGFLSDIVGYFQNFFEFFCSVDRNTSSTTVERIYDVTYHKLNQWKLIYKLDMQDCDPDPSGNLFMQYFAISI